MVKQHREKTNKSRPCGPAGRTKPSVRLVIACNGEQTELGGHKWMDASANELVQAARGHFLPHDAVPYRLLRKGRPVAFFDPAAPLRWAGPRDGDVLEAVVDEGQELETPSFAYVLRELSAARCLIVRDAYSMGYEAGFDPIDLSEVLEANLG